MKNSEISSSSTVKQSDWILESYWTAAGAGNGLLTLSLSNKTKSADSDIRLCFTSQLSALHNFSIKGGQLARRDGGYHEIVCTSNQALKSGEVWTVVLSDLSFKPAHANDGPITAFVIVNGSQFEDVQVVPMRSSSKTSLVDDISSDYAQTADNCLGVIPYPNKVELSPGLGKLPDAFVLSSNCAEDVIRQFEIAEDTFSLLFPGESSMFSNHASGMPIDVFLDGENAESYDIIFDAQQISIRAGALPGVFYAAVTLYQIVRGARLCPNQFSYPNTQSQVSDKPRFTWRGSHLDVARRYYTVANIKRFIAICAWYKLNRFHWHLTDDEGWRVEIKAYPQLTDIGSKRGYGHPIPPQFNDTKALSGGHFTQEDVLEIVAFALARHVEIMPEIDMPAHSTAALRSLPWLIDATEEANSYVSVHGFQNNALNPALSSTEQFVKTVIDELVPLFPFRVFHVGGDEVAGSAWHSSTVAKAMAQSLNKPITSGLHSYFVRQLQLHLSEHNKILGLWDDGVTEELDSGNAMVFAWRDPTIGALLADKGLSVVMTPGQYYYLDMARSGQWSEPGASWAGSTTTFDCYSFEFSTDTEKFHGIQCGIWSEHMHSEEIFNHLVYPRLLAVAESAWTSPRNKSWERFNTISIKLPGPWQLNSLG